MRPVFLLHKRGRQTIANLSAQGVTAGEQLGSGI